MSRFNQQPSHEQIWQMTMVFECTMLSSSKSPGWTDPNSHWLCHWVFGAYFYVHGLNSSKPDQFLRTPFPILFHQYTCKVSKPRHLFVHLMLTRQVSVNIKLLRSLDEEESSGELVFTRQLGRGTWLGERFSDCSDLSWPPLQSRSMPWFGWKAKWEFWRLD